MKSIGVLALGAVLLAGALMALWARQSDSREALTMEPVGTVAVPDRERAQELELPRSVEASSYEPLPPQTRAVVAAEDGRSELAHVSVRVLSKATGMPVSGVNMGMDREGEPAGEAPGSALRNSSLTAWDGQATFWLAPGDYEIGRRQGEDIQAGEVVQVPDEETLELEFYLPTELFDVLLGQIVDAESEEPVAHARIQVFDSLNEWWAHRGRLAESSALVTKYKPKEQATTNADGRFEATTWSVRTKVAAIDHPQYPGWYQQLDWSRSEAFEEPYRIKVPKAGTLIVAVVDGSSDVDGARVQLRLPQVNTAKGTSGSLERAWDQLTDGSGQARFERLPSGESIQVRVHCQGRIREESNVGVAPGEEARLVVDCSGGSTISGILRDAEGGPVGSETILLLPYSGDPLGQSLAEARATTNAASDGSFSFSDVPAGAWRVVADQDHVRIAPEEVRVPGDAWVELSATANGPRLMGNVLNPRGEPAVYTWVYAKGGVPFCHAIAMTDAAGHFELGPLFEGEYELGLSASPIGSARPMMVRAGEEELELRMREKASLILYFSEPLLDGTGLQVSSEAGVYTRPLRGDAAREPLRLGDLAPGTYSFGAVLEDGRYGVLSGVIVRSGNTTEATLSIQPTNARLRVEVESPLVVGGLEVFFEGVLLARFPERAYSYEFAAPPGRVLLKTLSDPPLERLVEVAEVGLTEYVLAR